MRIFIAVDLPEAVKKEIGRIQSFLKKAAAEVKWVKEENFHFTLKFIGETPEKKLAPVSEILEKLVQDEESFELSLKNLGVFPNFNRVRVIWLGADKGADNLKKLAQKVEENLAALGFAREEREFSGHLTLGRLKEPKNLAGLEKFLEEESLKEIPRFLVDRIKIFQSILKLTGPEYQVFKEIIFRG